MSGSRQSTEKQPRVERRLAGYAISHNLRAGRSGVKIEAIRLQLKGAKNVSKTLFHDGRGRWSRSEWMRSEYELQSRHSVAAERKQRSVQ